MTPRLVGDSKSSITRRMKLSARQVGKEVNTGRLEDAVIPGQVEPNRCPYGLVDGAAAEHTLASVESHPRRAATSEKSFVRPVASRCRMLAGT